MPPPKPLTGETALIAALSEIFGPAPGAVAVGIGDDCAALDVAGPDYLLWTVDTLIEGVHFDLAYFSLSQLGRKALAVNLSDIAAMGGEPLYALLSLGWPQDRDPAGALALGEGLAQIAREYGVAVIGGDTVASPSGVMVTLSLLGRVPQDEMRQRRGASVGDQIYVTGPLGEAAAGLEVLKRRLPLEPDLKEALCRAHLDPQPQLRTGRVLAEQKLATALIDLSDGVATDLGHICRASGVGARIPAAAAPVSPQVLAAAPFLGADPLDLALKGGEDYQLLFTSPKAHGDALLRAFKTAKLPPPLPLGEIVPGSGVLLAGPEGEKEITGLGFDHFRLDL
ncbi:MAG: thiamine-phosphate kinase [Thermodesulfobacteriota bacterium]